MLRKIIVSPLPAYICCSICELAGILVGIASFSSSGPTGLLIGVFAVPLGGIGFVMSVFLTLKGLWIGPTSKAGARDVMFGLGGMALMGLPYLLNNLIFVLPDVVESLRKS